MKSFQLGKDILSGPTDSVRMSEGRSDTSDNHLPVFLDLPALLGHTPVSIY